MLPGLRLVLMALQVTPSSVGQQMAAHANQEAFLPAHTSAVLTSSAAASAAGGGGGWGGGAPPSLSFCNRDELRRNNNLTRKLKNISACGLGRQCRVERRRRVPAGWAAWLRRITPETLLMTLPMWCRDCKVGINCLLTAHRLSTRGTFGGDLLHWHDTAKRQKCWLEIHLVLQRYVAFAHDKYEFYFRYKVGFKERVFWGIQVRDGVAIFIFRIGYSGRSTFIDS